MILAIETATKICGVAIVENGKIISEKFVDEKNVHSEKLVSFIDLILNESNLKLEQIKTIAVSSGPGSFTGLRIGMSIAKGICYAKNIPIILVPTLDGMANEFCRKYNPTEQKKIAVLLNAKKNESYFCFYEIKNGTYSKLTEYDIKERISIFREMKENRITILVSDEINENAKNEFECMQVNCSAESIGLIAEKNYKHSDLFSAEPIYVRAFK